MRCETPGRRRARGAVGSVMGFCFGVAGVLSVSAVVAEAKADGDGGGGGVSGLAGLSLEQLMQVEVTSVSRRPEPLISAPAAIAVVTCEDMHRMGATSIPEALRYVPGLQVGRVDAHQWAITARGFNDIAANKLQVIQDGRTLYTPLFSGVFWDSQDVFLEDIDRIEVVRGPGASLYGANAVNGVINIYTKDASQTQGSVIQMGGGTEDRVLAGARYGGKVGDSMYYRVYGKYADYDDSYRVGGGDPYDQWRSIRTGFRTDWDPTGPSKFTLQGDLYTGDGHQTFLLASPKPPFGGYERDTYHHAGGNLVGRWERTFSEASVTEVKAYYSRDRRNMAPFQEDRQTGDIEINHRLEASERHKIAFGVGYRISADSLENSYTVDVHPLDRQLQLFSAYARDEITLIKDHLKLTLGAQGEHNDFTGFEGQPTARLLWSPTSQQALWFSVSRAVRTPTRAERDMRILQPASILGTSLPAQVAFQGSTDYGSESLLAYELGYRIVPTSSLSLTATTFYYDYDDLRGFSVGTPKPGVPVVIPVAISNGLTGESMGFEAGPSWSLTPWWRLRGAYTFFTMSLHVKPGSTVTSVETTEGSAPKQQFSLRSSMDLGSHVQFDAGLRFVDELAKVGTASQTLPAYTELDLRLAWSPRANLEFAIVGQNLLQSHHQEYVPTLLGVVPAEVQRGVLGTVTWRF